MSKSHSSLEENITTLKEKINKEYGVNQNILTPIFNNLSTTITILPHFLSNDPLEFNHFLDAITQANNKQFYQLVEKRFKELPGDGSKTQFLLASCLLRDFITAPKVNDLKYIITAGIVPTIIVAIHEGQDEDSKESEKLQLLLANHMENNNFKERLLKYVSVVEILAEKEDLLNCLESVEQLPENLNLRKLQSIVISAIDQQKVTIKEKKEGKVLVNITGADTLVTMSDEPNNSPSSAQINAPLQQQSFGKSQN